MFFSVVPQCRFVFIQLLLLTRKGVDCNEIITVILLSNLSCYCVPVVNVIKAVQFLLSVRFAEQDDVCT